MEINGAPIYPSSLPIPSGRGMGAQAYGGQKQDEVETRRDAPQATEAPQAALPMETQGPDIRQIASQARVEQARHGDGTTFRMDSGPYTSQRAMQAYEEQMLDSQRILGGVELMPRVDTYI